MLLECNRHNPMSTHVPRSCWWTLSRDLHCLGEPILSFPSGAQDKTRNKYNNGARRDKRGTHAHMHHCTGANQTCALVTKRAHPRVHIGLGQVLQPHSPTRVLSNAKIVFLVIQQIADFLHVHLNVGNLFIQQEHRGDGKCFHKARMAVQGTQQRHPRMRATEAG